MRRLFKCLLVVVATAAVVLAGAGVLKASTATLRHVSGAQTFTVNVDGSNPKANQTFLAYYPDVVRVHAGDTVVFHEVGNGEPHTATLGTLANNAVAAFAKLSAAQQNNPPASALKADAKLPGLFPQGPGDAVQASANPCYLGAGVVPSSKAPCAQTSPTAFNGSQSFYNSGWLDSNARFTVHLSSSTPPGTYRYLCLLHREGMSGTIIVVPSSKSVPSPSAQSALGRKQLAAAEAQAGPIVGVVRQGLQALAAAKHVKLPASVTAGTAPVLAGGPAGIDEYGPKTVKIPVGGSVTWYLLGPHSITFNSTKANNDIRRVAPDGTVHINSAAIAPAGGPGEPGRPPTGGSQAHPKLVVVARTTWNGSGFLNSGVFGNSHGPPTIEGYRITFTRAGTYRYLCTVHDHMKGTIVVGG